MANQGTSSIRHKEVNFANDERTLITSDLIKNVSLKVSQDLDGTQQLSVEVGGYIRDLKELLGDDQTKRNLLKTLKAIAGSNRIMFSKTPLENLKEAYEFLMDSPYAEDDKTLHEQLQTNVAVIVHAGVAKWAEIEALTKKENSEVVGSGTAALFPPSEIEIQNVPEEVLNNGMKETRRISSPTRGKRDHSSDSGQSTSGNVQGAAKKKKDSEGEDLSNSLEWAYDQELDRDSLRANILDKTPRHKLPRGLKCVETHLPGSNILVGYGPRPSTVGHAELQAMKLRDKNKFHARNTAYGFYLATQDTPDRRTHSGLSYVNYFFPSVMLRSIRALSIHYMQVSNPNFDIPHADSPQIEKGGPECKAMQKALVDMICEDQGMYSEMYNDLVIRCIAKREKEEAEKEQILERGRATNRVLQNMATQLEEM